MRNANLIIIFEIPMAQNRRSFIILHVSTIFLTFHAACFFLSSKRVTQSHNNARRPKRASTCHITFSVFLTPSSFAGWSLTFAIPWGRYSRTCNWHWSEKRHAFFLIETDADWIRIRRPFLSNSTGTNLESPLPRFNNILTSIFFFLFFPTNPTLPIAYSCTIYE